MSFEIVDGVLEKYTGKDEIVRIPEGVRKIDTHAFSNCYSIQKLIYPGTLEYVQLFAYSNCRNITSAEFSPGIKTIPPHCCADLTELQNITIPEGVTLIDDSAFSNCEKLSCINLPSSITTIKTSAFKGCPNLKKIHISDLSSFMKIYFWSSDYRSYSLLDGERELFINGKLVEDIQIPDDLEETGHPLREYKFLRRVVIPASVKRISNEAFARCKNLREVVVLGNLEEIWHDAFWGCNDLTLVLPDRETYGNFKQSWQKNFTTIHILNDPITEVAIEDGETQIPDSQYARLGDLKKATIPDTVTAIGANAFRGCRKLELTKLPDNITTIGMSAFANCTSIRDLKLPEKLEEINDSAFASCSGITKIVIPASVRFIGPYAFAACKNLKEMTFESLVGSIDKEAFINCPSLTLRFPDGTLATKEKLPIALCSTHFVANEKELASIILYQKLKTWRDWILNTKIEKPEDVFEQMMIIYKNDKKAPSDAIASFVLAHIDSIKKEQVEELLRLMTERKYKGLDEFADKPEIQELLSGKKVEKDPIEEFVQEYLDKHELEPDSIKVVKSGLPYADSGKQSSKEAVSIIITEYMHEMTEKMVVDEFSLNAGMLQDGTKVCRRPDADRIGLALEPDALSGFLEKLIEKPSYRPFLLAWARYATDESIAQVTSTYKSMIRGKAKDQYKARNIREALITNDSMGAMKFFDRIGELDRYAAIRGMSAMTMRDSIMIPDFAFDEDGKKRYDIGGNTIEVSITSDLGFKLFDVNAQKEIRSFPKKSDNPQKAADEAKAYNDFKKEVINFAKDRTALIHAMHLSGELINPELWHKVYVDHPVIRHLSQLLVWQDESGNTFTVADGKIVDASNEPYSPAGKICVAHVLDLKAEDIERWHQALIKSSRKQLFDQIWEPVIVWEEYEITNRYNGVSLANEERNALKKALKQRGIESSAEYNNREYNPRMGQYVYGNEGIMYYGNSLRINFKIDEDTKEITFGKSTALTVPGNREMNAVLLELDKVTISSQIVHDHDAAINNHALSVFTASQISSLLNLAIENKSEKCTALLLNYKNEHFPEFAEVNEFSLDW